MDRQDANALPRLYDSELRIMNILWEQGDQRAAQVADYLKEEIGWNRNTSYTVAKKCVEKGYIQRVEPGFQCHVLLTKEQAKQYETQLLIDRLFDGDADAFRAYLSNWTPAK